MVKDTDRIREEDVGRAPSRDSTDTAETDKTVATTVTPESKPALEREEDKTSESASISQSLTSLEQDILAKQTALSGRSVAAAPNIHAANSEPGSELTRLEEEVAAKTTGSAADRALRPGATAVSGSGGLTRLAALERDVEIKQAASDHRATQPGAQHVGGLATSLSQLEQAVLTKTSMGSQREYPSSHIRSHSLRSGQHGRTAATQPGVVEEHGLTQLEQAVLAKASQSPAKDEPRPSEMAQSSAPKYHNASDLVGTITPDRAELSRLEQDVLAKAFSSGHSGAPSPGAVSIGGARSLAALERDIESKTVGGTDRNFTSQARTDPPSADLAALGGPASQGHPSKYLHQLERDVLLKGSISQVNSSNRPGSLSVTESRISAASSLSSLERDVMAKVTARSQTRPVTQTSEGAASSLSSLERDVMAKVTARSQTGPVTPNVHIASALNQLEQDALVKGSAQLSGGAGHDRATALHQMEADIQAKQSGDLVRNRGQSVSRFETEVINRQNLSAPMNSSTRNNLCSLEEQVAAKAESRQIVTMNPFHTEETNGTNRRNQRLDVPTVPPDQEIMTSTSLNSDTPEAPIETVPLDEPCIPVAGIQAFVAGDVVDATGVTVIASEEEEEKKQLRQQRRRLCTIGIILFAVVIAIVITIVIVLGEFDERDVGTQPPFIAPTVAPTLAPTSVLFSNLIQELALISGEDAFASRSSPQYMAAEWLVEEDSYEIALASSDPRFLQRYALAVLYFALGGPSWGICGKDNDVCTGDSSVNNWLSSTDDCTWYGLTCGDDGFLQEFHFRAAAGTEIGEKDLTVLEGELPFEVTLLTELTDFTADGFKLQGSIQDRFSRSPALRTLILSNNNITGEFPANLPFENPDLQTIDLSRNVMSGKLPGSISQLSSLINLRLNGNDFSGILVDDFLAQALSLQRLELQDNALSGEIPTTMYSLTALEILRLDMTNFSGSIANDIGQLSNLRELDLSGTQMTGSIPPEIYRLTNLTSLKVSQALFDGSLSEDVRFLNQTLELAYFDNNDFTGALPVESLGALTNLVELHLFGNGFTGTISSSSDLCGLVFTRQIQLIRTDCSVACECCAKCV